MLTVNNSSLTSWRHRNNVHRIRIWRVCTIYNYVQWGCAVMIYSKVMWSYSSAKAGILLENVSVIKLSVNEYHLVQGIFCHVDISLWMETTWNRCLLQVGVYNTVLVLKYTKIQNEISNAKPYTKRNAKTLFLWSYKHDKESRTAKAW